MRSVDPATASDGVRVRRAAGALVLISALTVGGATSPATAAPRTTAVAATAADPHPDDLQLSATATRAVFFQTRVWNDHDQVRSIGVRVPGEATPHCLGFDDVGDGYRYAALDVPPGISRSTAYTVVSYSYPNCVPTSDHPGTRGSVYPGRADKWTVYARYVPKPAL